MGVDANYLDTCSYTIKEGRGFDSNDYAKYRKVAILDRDSASSLFQGADAIGKTIEIQGEPYHNPDGWYSGMLPPHHPLPESAA